MLKQSFTKATIKTDEAKAGTSPMPATANNFAIRSVHIDEIKIKENSRPVDQEKVDCLVGSMKQIGLKTPPTVRQVNGEYLLGSGAHRLAAAKELGWSEIPCFIFSGDETEFQLWAISENLHRKELMALDRAELINEWRTLVEEKRKAGQTAHPGGNQPHNKDVSGTARELGITREEVRRAAEIDKISGTARVRIRERGLADKQSALFKIAGEPPDKQLKKVDELAVRKPRGPRKTPKSDTSATGAESGASPKLGQAGVDQQTPVATASIPKAPDPTHSNPASDAALIAFAKFMLARIAKIREVMTAEEKTELNALAERVRSVLGQRG